MKIDKLILFTSQISEQLHFYESILGFECLKKSTEEFELIVGDSSLVFRYKEKAEPYHFAFNIPAFSAKKAYECFADKVNLLPWNGEEIIQFKNWKAEALYFYDADKNIVELIAREAVDKESDSKFNTRSVLGISEIGIGTTDIRDIFNAIDHICPIKIYDGGLDRFCALGDEQGLFIVANTNNKTWMPTGESIKVVDFEIYGTYNFRYENGKINVIL